MPADWTAVVANSEVGRGGALLSPAGRGAVAGLLGLVVMSGDRRPAQGGLLDDHRSARRTADPPGPADPPRPPQPL